MNMSRSWRQCSWCCTTTLSCSRPKQGLRMKMTQTMKHHNVYINSKQYIVYQTHRSTKQTTRQKTFTHLSSKAHAHKYTHTHTHTNTHTHTY